METIRTIRNLEELSIFASEFLRQIEEVENNTTIVALHGDLGAGKTAFVQALGKVLKVEEAMTSPTFTIMRQYDIGHKLFDRLVHIDAYRLETEEEFRPLKIEELFKQPRTLVFIEWAEKMSNILPKEIFNLSFTINNDESRSVTITK